MLDIYTHCSQIQGVIPEWQGNFGEPDIKTAWEIIFPREERLRPYWRRSGLWLAVWWWISCGMCWGEGMEIASSHIPAEHLQQYSDLAVTWMQEYLRIDTTNPPGNEMRAVDFYKKILDQEAIENRTFEYSPGRGDLWARLPHTIAEAKRPLILLNHMDVVTSDRSHWQ